MDKQRIIVGYDGSIEARTAVDWAAAEASRTRSVLQIVYAYQFVRTGTSFQGTAEMSADAERRAARTVAEVADHVRKHHPGIEVIGMSVHSVPAPTLLDLGHTARLVVVGNRGGGGMTGLLLGSVSQLVATHSRTPVAVVRGRSDATKGPVVVGVDGSDSADAALTQAFEGALHRGAEIVAIRAYSPPSPLAVSFGAVEAHEQGALNASLHRWSEKYPTVKVTALLAVGRPAPVLIAASTTAQLVVVGSGGHGGLTGLLLGSVGQQLIHHAGCPVVIAHQA